MGGWSIVVNFMFPLPLVSLLLLSLPLPRMIASPLRLFTLRVLKLILFTKALYGFNLYQVAVFISVFLFLDSSYETNKAQTKMHSAESHLTEEHYRCLKWRSERNFWIAMLSLVCWIILQRMYTSVKEIEDLRREMEERDKQMKNE